VRVLKNKGFSRFAHKNGITDSRLTTAIKEAEQGLIDGDLGGGLIKKRIARDGEGKRGGFRTIIAYQRGSRAFFIFGFPKSAMENIADQDLADLRHLARVYANLTDEEITKAKDAGALVEVEYDGKKIQK